MISAVVTWLAEDWADALHVLLTGHASGRIVPFAPSDALVAEQRVSLAALPGSWVREGADVAVGELRSLVRPGLPLPGLLLPISAEPSSPVAVWVQALPVGLLPEVMAGESPWQLAPDEPREPGEQQSDQGGSSRAHLTALVTALREILAAVIAASQRDSVVMVPLLLDGEIVTRGSGEGRMAPTLLLPGNRTPLT